MTMRLGEGFAGDGPNAAHVNVMMVDRDAKVLRAAASAGRKIPAGFEVPIGQGKVNFPAILDAIAEIGFEGYANLETSSPSGSVESDVRRNLEYLRGLMGR